MEKTELLKYRRERRILRSRIFVLLKYAPKTANYNEILKNSLIPSQIEQVYDDLFYFIPNPAIRKSIEGRTISVGELVDMQDIQVVTQRPRVTKSIPFQFSKYKPHTHRKLEVTHSVPQLNFKKRIAFPRRGKRIKNKIKLQKKNY